jgi:hypothetical protein
MARYQNTKVNEEILGELGVTQYLAPLAACISGLRRLRVDKAV